MAEGTAFINTGRVIGEPLRMRFADGEHVIPPHIVEQAGGVKSLQEDAVLLASVTYEKFVRTVTDEAVARDLRRWQSQFINQSLMGGKSWGQF